VQMPVGHRSIAGDQQQGGIPVEGQVFQSGENLTPTMKEAPGFPVRRRPSWRQPVDQLLGGEDE